MIRCGYGARAPHLVQYAVSHMQRSSASIARSRRSERLAAKIERQARRQHVVAFVEQLIHQLKEPGIARKELHLVERNHLKPASDLRFPRPQYRPDLRGICHRNLLRQILIALAALEQIHPAAHIGPRLEHGDLLIAVSAQRIDLGQQVPGLARRHVADKQSQKLAASHFPRITGLDNRVRSRVIYQQVN